MVSAKNIILSIAIAIVFMLFGVYAINLIYKQPQYNDFCGTGEFYPKVIRGPVPAETCINQTLTDREQQCYANGSTIIKQKFDDRGCVIDFECSGCNKDFDAESKTWRRGTFVAAVIVGVVGLAVGALLFSIEAIGAGLMGGGAFLIFVNAVRAWEELSDGIRVIILALALVALIYIGILINRRRRR